MTLDEFIDEEARRVVLFHAYWLENVRRGETHEGMPIWPVSMLSGDWDHQLLVFESLDAENIGITAEKIEGKWVAVITPPDVISSRLDEPEHY